MNLVLPKRWSVLSIPPIAILLACISQPTAPTRQDPKAAPSADGVIAALRASEIASQWAAEAEAQLGSATADAAEAKLDAEAVNEALIWLSSADWRTVGPRCEFWAEEARAWALMAAEEAKTAPAEEAAQTTRRVFSSSQRTSEHQQAAHADHEVVRDLARRAESMAEAIARVPKSEDEANEAARRQAWNGDYDYENHRRVPPKDAKELLHNAQRDSWRAVEATALAKAAEVRGRAARQQGVALAEATAAWDAVAKWAAAPEQAGAAHMAAESSNVEAAGARKQLAEATTEAKEAKERIPGAQADVKQTKKDLDEATAAYEKELDNNRRGGLARSMNAAHSAWKEAVEKLKEVEAEVVVADQAVASAKATLTKADAKAGEARQVAATAAAAIAKLQADAKQALNVWLQGILRAKVVAEESAAKWKAEAATMHKAAAKWEAEGKAIARAKAAGQ